MSAQDVLPGLEGEEEQVDTPAPGRRRWLLAGAVATVVALAGAVVVVQRLAATPLPMSVPTPSTAPARLGPPTDTTATAQQGSPLIRADLSYPGVVSVVPTAPLVIGTQPVQGGVVPERVPNFDSCHADAASLQYLPVQIRMPENWLSATVTVGTTAATPRGIGRLGFFFQAGPASTPCANGAWSASDSFLASNVGQAAITGYIVLDQAFTASTPQGRTGVFGTLALRVSDIRLSDRPAEVHPPTIGSFCPGTTSDLCASLG